MMLLLAFVFLLPITMAAQAIDGDIEELITNADGESSLADSLELAAAQFLYSAGSDSCSHDDLPLLTKRVRFWTSASWDNSSSLEDLRRTWARTRLTVYTRDIRSADLLLVRRAHDPRTIDELHLSISGVNSSLGIKYVLGTYQIEWGMGVLSSGSFGAMRSLSVVRSARIKKGRGVIARTTSRESAWLRGVTIEKQVSCLDLGVFANSRDWNAVNDSGQVSLTGVYSPLNFRSDVRDKVSESGFGGFVGLRHSLIHAGVLAQQSNFEPSPTNAPTLNSQSGYFKIGWEGGFAIGEIARSADNTAWAATLTHGTLQWQGALYSIYAPAGYFAPRSQGPFDFGEELEGTAVVGAKAGTYVSRHEFAFDLNSSKESNTVPGDSRNNFALLWHAPFNEVFGLTSRLRLSERSSESGGRRSLTFRCDPVWGEAINVSARLEYRRFETNDGSEFGNGSYIHMQVMKNRGKLRPGVRVAEFNLSELDFPLSVYERNVSGAYPFEQLFGNGTRLIAWMSYVTKSISIGTKLAWTSSSVSSDDVETAVSMSISR